MSTWIEIRCENLHERSAYGARSEDCCWSNDKKSPTSISDDSQADVVTTLRRLTEEAREAGWEKGKGGWLCPYCKTVAVQKP